MSAFRPQIPLPCDWPEHAKTGLVQAVALAHLGLTHIRGWCVESPITRVKLKGENARLRAEVGQLREEIRIKDARMARIPAANRPYYPPAERFAILQLKAARAWNLTQTARTFLVAAATIASWQKRLDEDGADALVRIPVPVNRFPDLVSYLVAQLRALLPAMGKVRVADLLARAGLVLGATTVKRLAERAAHRPKPRGFDPAGRKGEKAPTGRTVTANYPHHVWNLDFTVVPTGAGLCAPWLPFCLPQVWPFCWWVAVILDHFSRRLIGFAVFKKEPTSKEVCVFLDQAIKRARRRPKYTVSDQGTQFREEFRAWCKLRGIRARFGAVGKQGSIALTERFIRTLKDECTRRILVPMGLGAFRKEIRLFGIWYNACRPSQALAGRTPLEVFAEGQRHRKDRAVASKRAPIQRERASPHRNCDTPPLALHVTYLEGRKHLPIVELRKAA